MIARTVAITLAVSLAIPTSIVTAKSGPLIRQGRDCNWQEQAVVPDLADFLRPLGPARAELFECANTSPATRAELRLPRYTGAGETAIHVALRKVRLLLDEYYRTNHSDAYQAAEEVLMRLREDLEDARDTGSVLMLNDTWNSLFPSTLHVDLLFEDVSAMLEEVTRFDEEVLEINMREVGADLAAPSDLEGPAEVAAFAQRVFALNKRKTFRIEIDESLRSFFDGESSFKLHIQGSEITPNGLQRTFREFYKEYRFKPWEFVFDPPIHEDDTIPVGQRIKLVPADRFGSTNLSIWIIPLVVILLLQVSARVNFWADIASVPRTLFGTRVDPAFGLQRLRFGKDYATLARLLRADA
jgi:hypothetical protein